MQRTDMRICLVFGLAFFCLFHQPFLVPVAHLTKTNSPKKKKNEKMKLSLRFWTVHEKFASIIYLCIFHDLQRMCHRKTLSSKILLRENANNRNSSNRQSLVCTCNVTAFHMRNELMHGKYTQQMGYGCQKL